MKNNFDDDDDDDKRIDNKIIYRDDIRIKNITR